ncbi:hypothetical protein [Loigolactobacillus backii]|uniref:hypothetical protein n=1 Tax=Loigolactobacillus backii TaxID=375175 RepID=UPI0012E9490E|nr:hypothetical protein [Loigolactobacillus backii]
MWLTTILQVIIILGCLYTVLTTNSSIMLVLTGLVMATLILVVMNKFGLYLHPRHRHELRSDR